METIQIPPWCLLTIRCSEAFHVEHETRVLGPDSSTARVFRIQTAADPMEVKLFTSKSAHVSQQFDVRPDPREHNSGIPVEVSAPVSEPTIQEMIRTYVRQALADQAPQDLETPDEFFDFDDDEDETQAPLSAHQIMDDEYPLPPPSFADTERSDSGGDTETGSQSPGQQAVESDDPPPGSAPSS